MADLLEMGWAAWERWPERLNIHKVTKGVISYSVWHHSSTKGVYSEYLPVPLTTSHLHLKVCREIVRLLVRFQILQKLFWGENVHFRHISSPKQYRALLSMAFSH